MVEHQEREAKLLPVVSCIFVCCLVILGGSYLIGTYLF